MLTLDRFPKDHVGICTACKRGSGTASPPLQQRARPISVGQDTVSEHGQSSEEQLPEHVRQGVRNCATLYSNVDSSMPSSIHRQRNPHSVLPGSVTTYSDAGQYPSGRSTYGVTKPRQNGRRGRTQTSALRTYTSNNVNSQALHEGLTARKLQELKQLFRSLSQTDYNSFIRSLRRESEEAELTQSPPTLEAALDETTRSTSETQDEDSTAGITLYPVTPAVTKCIEEICELWDVPDIAYIFPKAIWPNPSTLWPIGVLREFREMAQEYPSQDSRQGISTKFTGLVQARRGRSNAKSQWSIVDARTTHAWAKEQYGSGGASDADEDDGEHHTAMLRSSQLPQSQATLTINMPLQGEASSKRPASLRTYSRKRRS